MSTKTLLEQLKKGELTPQEGLDRYKALQAQRQGDAELLYLQCDWQPVAAAAVSLPAGDILVFDASGELYHELRRRWVARELPPARWARVVPGDAFGVDGDCYRLPAGDGESYARLLDELGFRPGLIVHAWSEGGYDPERLTEQLERGVQSLFHLSRALLQQPSREPLEIHCLADNASPLDRALGGFARTLRQEAPHCRCKVITMAEADPEQRAARVLMEWGRDDETEIRYRNGERTLRHLREVPPPAESAPTPWRERGVYLISGGLGGIGRQLAAHLLSRYQARLLLCGRSALDGERQVRLAQLRTLGGEVFYLQADVAERSEVEKLVAALKGRYGALHGVIHAAGVLRDSYLLKKGLTDLRAVLQSKVWGTQWLDLSTREEPLELFVLCSSAAAVVGNPGQADYAYANSFQDHYAHWRAACGAAGRSLSLNWPLWETGGMGIDTEAKAHMKREQGLVPLRSASALRALDAGLRLETPQLMVLEGERQKIRAALLSPRAMPSNAAKAATGGEKKPADKAFRQRVEAYLKDLLAQEIKLPVDRIETHEPFENYGIDSVRIIRLSRALERHFGELSKTLFFEYLNLKELANYFIERHQPRLRHLLDAQTAEAGASSPGAVVAG
ncbi:MAG: beta-ketoacyl reductase, partial [Candidatus Thiodiazotropha sp.]